MRVVNSIEAFVKRALKPSVQDVPGQQLVDFTASDDFVFIAKLQGESESINAHYRDFAHEYSDRYSFGITTSNSVGSNGIWCYNNVDGTQHAASDLNDPDALKRLLNNCTAEIIPQLTRRNEMTHLSVCLPFSPPSLCAPSWLLTPILVRAVLSLLLHKQ